MNKLGVAFAALAALLAQTACRDANGPTEARGGPQFMTLYGCEITPECSGEGGDPNPTAAGYWMGTTVTPDLCFSPDGSEISDVDLDGMSDYCESLLADRFRPSLVSSPYDLDSGKEPYWAAKYFPSNGVVRIAYLLAYYQDPGSPSSTWGGTGCTFAPVAGITMSWAGFLTFPAWWSFVIDLMGGASFYAGSRDDWCGTHRGDSEFITVDVVYDAETRHWYTQSAFMSAHWTTEIDKSDRYWAHQIEYREQYGGFPRVWVSEGKHANYPTRHHCSAHGGPGDTCDANSLATEARIRSSDYYNLGSFQHQLLNCVSGGALVHIYPEAYSQECFWAPNTRFEGWQPYRLNTVDGTSTAYSWVLFRKFECYSFADESNFNTCSDWGVDRSNP